MGGRIRIQNWVERKAGLYCSTRKASASPAVTSRLEMTLQSHPDLGLGPVFSGSCVKNLLDTGYSWNGVWPWVKLSSAKLSFLKRGYKSRTLVQKLSNIWGRNSSVLMVILVAKNSIHNKKVLPSSGLDKLLVDDPRPKCHFHSFMFSIPSTLQ